MNISPELFMAILSMDSYNRGYGAGIGDQDGLGSTSDGTIKVGDATITKNIVDAGIAASAVDAGFYAIAYAWGNQKVISYRGTDDPLSVDPSNDILTGWLLGAGVSGASQADLALQFSAAPRP